MKITIDTNVLVRYTMADDPGQAQMARRVMSEAETVCVPVTALCEYVWVLRRGYRLTSTQIKQALQTILNAANVHVDHAVVDAGIAVLDKGGDFADGVIACEGQWLSGDEFVTFDRQAARILTDVGIPARCLEPDE